MEINHELLPWYFTVEIYHGNFFKILQIIKIRLIQE